MLASFRLRVLFVALVLTLPFVTSACSTTPPNHQARANTYMACLKQLVPDGRIYPDDLSADNPRFEVQGAWLTGTHVIVEDDENNVTALDRTDLAPKWYYSRLKAPLDFAPFEGPTAVVMLAHGVLHEVERSLGSQLHVFKLDVLPSAGAVSTPSTVYLPALAGTVGTRTITTINFVTGLEGWGLSTRTSVSHAPLMGGTEIRQILYFVTEGGGVYAYPAEPAASAAPDPSWTARTHGHNETGATLGGAALYVGSDAGDFWSFDRVTGQTNWVKWFGVPLTKSAWEAGDLVFVRTSKALNALHIANGLSAWSTKPADFLVRRQGTVYVTPGDGVVKVLDEKTGETLRSVKFPKGTRFLANQTDATFYAISHDGQTFAVALPLQ